MFGEGISVILDVLFSIHDSPRFLVKSYLLSSFVLAILRERLASVLVQRASMLHYRQTKTHIVRYSVSRISGVIG